MSDQFGATTQQNILSGGDGAKSYGWFAKNTANVTVFDINNVSGSGAPNCLQMTYKNMSYNATNAPFLYQKLVGDFDVNTRVQSYQPYAWASLMARDDLVNPGHENAVEIRLDGFSNQYWYNWTNDTLTNSGSGGSGTYLRINRTGNVFTLYGSGDGSTWTQMAQWTRNDLSSAIYVGFYGYADVGHAGVYNQWAYFNGTYTAASLPSTTTALASDTNPANAGATVTFTATVTGSSPTGTVTFKDGASTLGTGTLNGSYRATCATSSLAAGTHSITAEYGGDSNNAGSTSSTLNQLINVVVTIGAAVTMPDFTGAGASAQTGNFCDNSLPAFVLIAEFAATSDAEIELTALNAAALGGVSNITTASLYCIPPTINAGLTGGAAVNAASELPVFTVESLTAATGALSMPSLLTYGEHLTGRSAYVQQPLKLPRFTVDTLEFNCPIIHMTTALPVVDTSIGLLAGGGCDCNASLSAFKMPSLPYVNAYAGVVISAAAAAPRFVVTTSGYGEYKGDAAVAAPHFAINALMSFTSEGGAKVVVLNVDTGGLTEYTSYDFNGFCKWGDEYFAEGDTGIYALGAQTDDGEPISCSIRTSKTELKSVKGAEESSVKRVTAVHAVVKSPEPFVFKATTDNGIENVYMPEYAEAAKTERPTPRLIKLGKGMRGRFWQFAVENTGGAPLEIESFEPEVASLGRKV